MPKLTDPDKQATGNREPADEMNKEDPTQGIRVLVTPFHGNLEDLETHVLAHSSAGENSDSEGDASKVETQKRKHSVHVYFRKNQKRSVLRAEKYGDLTTTEHKIISEGCESRNKHRHRGASSRHSVESVSNQNFTGDGEEFWKFTETVAEAKSCSYVQFLIIWKVLWRIIMELSNNSTSSIRNKRNCRTSCTSSERRDISRIIAIWIGWQVVVRFYGMPLLTARWPRPHGRREISKWTKIWRILLRHALFAGGIWEADIPIAEIEELE